MSSEKKLDVDDVFCVACRCIYIRPVTMPCNHSVCLECFKRMVNITAYQCPICRKRISNWLRKFKHEWDSLVNEKFWEEIQQQFPLEVQKRLNDEDDGLEEIIVRQGFVRKQTEKGEVRKEFDAMMIQFRRKEMEKEMESYELAKKYQELEEETHRVFRKKIEEDAILAAMIQEEMERELQEKQREDQRLLHESECLARKLQDKMERELQEGGTLSNQSDEDLAEQLPDEMENELPEEGTFSNESDEHLARWPQYQIERELQQEYTFSSESDKDLEEQLPEEDQMKSEVKKADVGVQIKQLPASKREQPKKLPLGNIFEGFFDVKKSPEVQHNDTGNGYAPQSPNTSSSFTSSSTSSSSNPSFNSTATDVSVTSGGYNIFDECTCGRSQGGYSGELLCQFCADQIAHLEKYAIQYKNDYLMAKELEESFRKENFEDYNLRKRTSSTRSASGGRKKVAKLSRGQQTIKQAMRVKNI